MTFFYNLNKKLDEIRATPSTTHSQLNERDMSRAAKGYEKYNKYDESVEEGLGDVVKKVGGMAKKVGSKALDTLGHGSDEDMIKDLQKKMGMPQTGQKPRTPLAKEAAAPMSPKQKSFAALAEPKDKITFADKIAGAKKEVDEMLGDVAAEAMKSAVGATRKIAGKRYGGAAQTDDGPQAKPELPRGRGRPKKSTDTEQGADLKPDWSAFGVKKVKLAPHKGEVTKHKLSDKEPGEKVKEAASEDDIQILIRMRDEAFEDGNKMLGNKIEDILQMLDKDEEQVSEKAVSKKQQKFMGMVHAAQKGKKPASKEVAKVAKEMPKKAAKDFAATKHEGLPEKKKSDAPKKAKKEKTEEAGGTDTPTASSGFSYGKGIYDSLNREVEGMIAEGMNISMNMTNDQHGGPGKSLTVTATDEDASKLAELLKMAGIGGAEQGGCGCGSSSCSCNSAEVVDENSPDWPTDKVVSDDSLQYSGGLNKPKSTGQTTVPVIASQEERQESYAEAEEDAIKRMMEMAGIEFTDEMLEEDWKNKLAAAGMAGAMALGSLGAGAAQAAPQQGLGTPTAATQQQTQDIWMPAYKRALSLSSATKSPELKQEIDKLQQFYLDQSGRIGLSGKLSKNMEPKAAQDQKQLDLTHKDRLEKLMQRYGVNEEQVMAEEDDLARMMEMAGIKKKAVDEEKTEEGNKFTGNLAKARAAGKKEADLDGDGDMEKVRESIFTLTNQWKAYKG
jgi:hypothetical protein